MEHKIIVELSDVLLYGSIDGAIEAIAKNSEAYASGVVGPEFSTSGPGSGWSSRHDACDFAKRALDEEYGAQYYVDSEDGRVAFIEDDEMLWTPTSVVELVVPSVESAVENAVVAAKMAKSALDTHAEKSDCDKWTKLVRSIIDAGETFSAELD